MSRENHRYSRQSFLGPDAEANIRRAVVGVVGLGGGGSHIVQQLAHIGFKNYVVYDPDIVEESNLNRLVGATEHDVELSTPKVVVAKRQIVGLQPDADVIPVSKRWQDEAGPLRGCDIIFGCLDGFAERRELETCARHYLVPLIDIGMDVNRAGDEPPRMAGQVIVSMPGHPCLTCVGFLNEATLAREAARYGAAGPRPQVIWPNGVLASSAVGLAVDLLTDWTRSLRGVVYLSYDSNRGTIQPHVRYEFVKNAICSHFICTDIGDPVPTLV
ncbi:MAG: ThiF family adenylyltransferase [Tepidisphaeraceae bacterium]